MEGDSESVWLADISHVRAQQYAAEAIAAVRRGDSEMAYHFAMLAAHKAAFHPSIGN